MSDSVPNEEQARFIIAAYDSLSSEGVLFDYRPIGTSLGFDSRQTTDFGFSLQREGWLSMTGEWGAILSLTANAFAFKTRESRPPIDFSDIRLRHLMVLDYEGWVDGSFPQGAHFDYIGPPAGYSREETDQITTMLWKEGYVTKRGSGITIQDRGKEVGKRFFEEAKAKRTPQDDRLSKRWKDRAREGDRFLMWAWRQHRGDLNKDVDARAYAFAHGLSRYELQTVLKYLTDANYIKDYINEPTDMRYVNEHAMMYWNEPFNTFLRYGYFVALMPEGEAAGAKLVVEHQQRFRRYWNAVFTFARGTKGAVVGLAGLLMALFFLAGYWKGLSHQPTAQSPNQSTHPSP